MYNDLGTSTPGKWASIYCTTFLPNTLPFITPNRLQIGLHPFPRGSRRPGIGERTAGIEFEVDNVDFWYRTLRKRGVKFSEKPKDSWGEREARFTDPDGYRLAISSPAKKSSK
ncbi:VOC family protein [Candidatus Bathyarchaeota archaeon]|nr:MAG: VOC family protein [Candidatus Bathyarchaeota archaeon]